MKPLLLLHLDSAHCRQRTAIGPTLAAAAQRAGVGYECYYDDHRLGRHFGGGDPPAFPAGASSGSLVVGGRHADQVLWLATGFELLVLGDPSSVLWPAAEAAGAEVLVRSSDPAELYGAVFERLGLPVPTLVLVLDGGAQGRGALEVAPYLAPAFFCGEPALGLDVGCGEVARRRLEALGAGRFHGLWLAEERAASFPGGLDVTEGDAAGETYASLTAALAVRHQEWGHGVLLGDPQLVAAQLGRLARRRLLPIYGRPQADVLARAQSFIASAAEPVFGRQYDDRDFFELARLGRGLQVVDPDPPFDSARDLPRLQARPDRSPWEMEPDDDQLREWAAEGRVLVTLCLWAGMVREIDGLRRLIDLVAATGLHAGLVITAETVEHGAPLSLLAHPVERGGVLGLLEPLVGCTGRGVAAESLLPPGVLASSLREACQTLAERLPEGLVPRGWWPLLDATLVPHRAPRIGRRGLLPVVFFTSRGPASREEPVGRPGEDSLPRRRDARAAVGNVVRATPIRALFAERRPFDEVRPGPLDTSVAEAVHANGFSYMWTKAAFGTMSPAWRRDDFLAVPFTAGNWDGWSPFYTIGSVDDLDRAEAALLRRGRPGWLASTIDSPLFALSGEVWEHGARLHRIAARASAGGATGRLVNVTPNVVARYARLLDQS